MVKSSVDGGWVKDVMVDCCDEERKKSKLLEKRWKLIHWNF